MSLVMSKIESIENITLYYDSVSKLNLSIMFYMKEDDLNIRKLISFNILKDNEIYLIDPVYVFKYEELVLKYLVKNSLVEIIHIKIIKNYVTRFKLTEKLFITYLL